jgi:hypothetical protein
MSPPPRSLELIRECWQALQDYHLWSQQTYKNLKPVPQRLGVAVVQNDPLSPPREHWGKN